MLIIDNKYDIGQEVFLITDPDQLGRMVTAVIVTHGQTIKYELKSGTEVTENYEMEISKERDMHRMMFEVDDDDE